MKPALLRLALLATTGAARLAAQTETPSGLAAISLAAGGGSGSLQVTCQGCPSTYYAAARSARVWMARIAFANTAHTVIGVEYDNWQQTRSFLRTDPITLDRVPFDETTSVSWIDLTLQWYPVARGALAGLYVKGALGLTTLKIDPGTNTLKNTGGGAGVGWDIPVTKLFALTPSYDILSAQKTKLPGQSPPNHPAPSFGALMNWYGLAIKFKGIP